MEDSASDKDLVNPTTTATEGPSPDGTSLVERQSLEGREMSNLESLAIPVTETCSLGCRCTSRIASLEEMLVGKDHQLNAQKEVITDLQTKLQAAEDEILKLKSGADGSELTEPIEEDDNDSPDTDPVPDADEIDDFMEITGDVGSDNEQEINNFDEFVAITFKP